MLRYHVFFVDQILYYYVGRAHALFYMQYVLGDVFANERNNPDR